MKPKNKLGKFCTGIGIVVMMLATISIRTWADQVDGVTQLTGPADGSSAPTIAAMESNGHNYDANGQETGDVSTMAGTQGGAGGGGGSCPATVNFMVSNPANATGSSSGGTPMFIEANFSGGPINGFMINKVLYVPQSTSMINVTDLTSWSSLVAWNGGRCQPGGFMPAANVAQCIEAIMQPGMFPASTGGFSISWSGTEGGIGCQGQDAMTWIVDAPATINP